METFTGLRMRQLLQQPSGRVSKALFMLLVDDQFTRSGELVVSRRLPRSL
ncbi:hypothetical protein [Kitasatospora purpeofusca]